VTSLVHGEDFVSRLSRRALDTLKSDVNQELKCCNQHKRDVLFSSMSNRFYNRHRTLRPIRELGKKLTPNKQLQRVLGSTDGRVEPECDESIQMEVLHSSISSPEDLYFPGRILYVEKCRIFDDTSDNLSLYTKRHSLSLTSRLMPWNKRNSSLPKDTPYTAHASTRSGALVTLKPEINGKYAYCPRWVSREEFKMKIVVSSTMLSDHWSLPILSKMSLVKIGKLQIDVEE
jgi:hypothetical protein